MHNIWGRVAQARCKCKCPSCVFTKAAVARRAVTTGPGQFIKPVLHSATFTYSAIFAGAVALDGGVKRSRRQKLDEELREAKERLVDGIAGDRAEETTGDTHGLVGSVSSVPVPHEASIVHAQQPERDGESHEEGRSTPGGIKIDGNSWLDTLPGTPKEGHDAVLPQDASIEQISHIQESEQAAGWHEQARRTATDIEILDGISWLEAQQYDVEHGNTPAWPRNSGPPVDRKKLPPQSLWADDKAAEKAASNVWTGRKLRTFELAVSFFVLKTLHHKNICADGPVGFEEVPLALRPLTSMTRKEQWNALRSLDKLMWKVRNAARADWEQVYTELLQSEPRVRRGLPHFAMDEQCDFRVAEQQLRRSIWTGMDRALKATSQKGRQEDLILQVCNDLMTSSAPPTHNTINLLLFGFTKLGDRYCVEEVRRMMTFAHVRINERTCVAVLNHYTLCSDVTNFTHFIDKMRGSFGGLALANPGLELKHSNSEKVILKPDAESRKLVQKVQPTPMVLNAIIAGLLKFLGFESSIKLVKHFQNAGWGLDKEGLELFLADCLRARDFDNGLTIWRQIEEYGPLSRTDAKPRAMMLRLCLDRGKEDQFWAIYGATRHIAPHVNALDFLTAHRRRADAVRARLHRSQTEHSRQERQTARLDAVADADSVHDEPGSFDPLPDEHLYDGTLPTTSLTDPWKDAGNCEISIEAGGREDEDDGGWSWSPSLQHGGSYRGQDLAQAHPTPNPRPRSIPFTSTPDVRMRRQPRMAEVMMN